MIYQLVVRGAAQKDLMTTRTWYEGQLEGLGNRFLVAVEEAFVRISEMPLLYAEEHRHIRRAGVTGFPFYVCYRVLGELIEVLAVMHGSQNPRSWKKRA